MSKGNELGRFLKRADNCSGNARKNASVTWPLICAVVQRQLLATGKRAHRGEAGPAGGAVYDLH